MFKEKLKYHYNLFIAKCLFFGEHILGRKLFKKVFSEINEVYIRKAADYKQSVKGYQIFDKIKKSSKNIMLFKGFAGNWKAVENWDFEYFAANYGDRQVDINGKIGLTYDVGMDVESISLKDYLSQVKNGSKKYLKLSSLVQDEPELQKQLDYKNLGQFKSAFSTGETYYTFIGGSKSFTPMHNEVPCNVFVQVYGRKRWVLYHPNDFLFLGVHAERRPHLYSAIHPDNLDDENFPYLKYANKIEIILEPGDILYVPPLYFHYVENLTDSISVAYKFANVPIMFRVSKFLTFLFFLATRPSLFVTFFANRLGKEDHILKPKFNR